MCFPLDPQQRKGIARRRHQTHDYRLGMRLSTLLWRDDGQTEPDIAQLLGVCERTGRNWLRLYRKKGLDGLCTLTALMMERFHLVPEMPAETVPVWEK